MTTGSIAVEEALLFLKIGFLLLLYLFIWRIVRTASRDLRTPQESFVMAMPRGASPPKAQPASAGPPVGRLTVVASPSLTVGDASPLHYAPLVVGRSSQCDLAIGSDDFASARHARFEPRPNGVWLFDLDSTNGTFVNGAKIAEPRLLKPGDLVRIGQTELRFEP